MKMLLYEHFCCFLIHAKRKEGEGVKALKWRLILCVK